MPVKVIHTKITTSITPGLESMTTVSSPQALFRALGLLRLLQLSSSCVTFSIVVHMEAWAGPMGNWCLFSWFFSFFVTLIILIVELTGLHSRFPKAWLEIPITCACYATLFCLTSSIIYPTTFVKFMSHGYGKNQAIRASIFSCIACLAYATEVIWTLERPGHGASYMTTPPGMLKIIESFIACLIFAFLSNRYLYRHEPALEWCVAMYSISFILTMMVILPTLGNFTITFPNFLRSISFICVLLYSTAMVLWPLYQFSAGFRGQPNRGKDSSCGGSYTVCSWDRKLTVAILTGVNLLLYTFDFINYG
ncbi:myeloid-associated differentiation marker-like [Psammomys obesus]|uniref:myeloid-associated differentiation marker-like n=1 Tax=Psammomys obesus TaxID=48139 RepID=UPI0024531113|nr:myeloid-associated differentiation marker-like [Psammomys obesus]